MLYGEVRATIVLLFLIGSCLPRVGINSRRETPHVPVIFLLPPQLSAPSPLTPLQTSACLL